MNEEAKNAEEEIVKDETAEPESTATKQAPSGSLKDTWKKVFGQALNAALKGRGNVVMVRVNDEALEHLEMLIEAEITQSRSESAAFLINQGIYANQQLFDRVGATIQQINDLRAQLREQVQREIKKE